ncbi:DUF4135 domain-containing protein [Streptomyces olivaceus]|uniref:DUF4135 domain-containing protein n=1 Tax=Streptomyces olivaceus TaxID=47716 RepID=UPI001CCBA586|nr:DUF4135 domain-containing protein [Streptomyces olivaceus]MBZ6260599.1 DUF4135 domain-containing protein [Streptomyces olivaceus]
MSDAIEEMNHSLRRRVRAEPRISQAVSAVDPSVWNAFEESIVIPPSTVQRVQLLEASNSALLDRSSAHGSHLSRFLRRRIGLWADAYVNFFIHFVNDMDELAQIFGPRSPLVSVSHCGGDEHCRGRAVLMVRFASGQKIIYKPRGRPLLPLLSCIIEAVEKDSGPMGLRMPRTLARRTYCWSEFISEPDSLSASFLMSSYRSLGALAALAWALGGRDLHGENLVFSPDGLYVLDEECFFSPLLPTTQALPSEVQRTLAFYQDSVAYTGLLPMRPVVAGVLQDDCSAMKILDSYARELSDVPGNWQEPFVAAFDRTLDSFHAVWPLLQSHPFLWSGHGAESRVVLRSTQAYSDLLGLHFATPATSEVREQMHLYLQRSAAFESWRADLLLQEVDDLMTGDVPLITAPIGHRNLIIHGEEFAIASCSGLQAVHRRWTSPAAQHAAKLEARASLQVMALNGDLGGGQPHAGASAGTTASAHQRAEPLHDAAFALACALGQLAKERHDGCIGWSGIQHTPIRGWHVADGGTSLASGSTGIMLALTAASMLATRPHDEPAAHLHDLTRRLWKEWGERALERIRYPLGGTAAHWLLDDLTVLALATPLKRQVPDGLPELLLSRCHHLKTSAASTPAVQKLLPFLACVLGDLHAVIESRIADGAAETARSLLAAASSDTVNSSLQEATCLVSRRAAIMLDADTPLPQQDQSSSAVSGAFVDFAFAAAAADVDPAGTALNENRRPAPHCEGWGLQHGVSGQVALYSLLRDGQTDPTGFGALPGQLSGTEPQQLALSLTRPGLSEGAAGLLYELARHALPTRIPALLLIGSTALLAHSAQQA